MALSDGLPNDADGDALRRLIADGSSLDRPMAVDFQTVLPDSSSAEQFRSACSRLGYHTAVIEEEGGVCATCTTRLLPTYAAVVAIQEELSRIASPLGGKVDGWGSYGNRDE